MASAESPIFSRMRGKIGDLITCQNWNDAISIRSYNGSPDYPDTIYQQYAKTSMTYASALWESLTDEQRQAWHNYAMTIETRKPFAKTNPTGRMAFCANLTFIKYLDLRYGLYPSPSPDPPQTTGYAKTPFTTEYVPSASGTPRIGIHWENYSNENIRVYYTVSNPFNLARNKADRPFNASISGNKNLVAGNTYNETHNLDASYIGKCCFVKHDFISNASPHRRALSLITRHIVVT